MDSAVLLDRALEAVRHLVDPEPPWEAALETASRLIGTDGAVLIVNRQGQVDVKQVGADPAAVSDYAQHFHAHDVLLPLGMVMPVGTRLETQSALSQRERARSRYYTDFMCRHRMRQLGSVVLSRQSALFWSSFGVQRATPDDALLERMNGPLVARYFDELNVAIAARSRRAEQWMLTADAMFDSIGQATLLVSPEGWIVHIGRHAESKLSASGLLRHRALWHSQESVRVKLTAALTHANAGDEGVQLRIPVSNGEALHLGLVKAASTLRLLNEDLIFVCARVCPAPSSGDVQALRDGFGITFAEAKVLVGLVNGEVAKEYASRERISVHTVRKQIAMLMLKMNCSRQLELVQKAMAVLAR